MKTLEDVLEEITPQADPDFVADMEWRMRHGFPPQDERSRRLPRLALPDLHPRAWAGIAASGVLALTVTVALVGGSGDRAADGPIAPFSAEDGGGGGGAGSGAGAGGGAGATAGEGSEAALRREAVRAALARLEPRERELVALKFAGGLSNEEIARVIRTSASNVGTRLHRTMEKLRRDCDEDA